MKNFDIDAFLDNSFKKLEKKKKKENKEMEVERTDNLFSNIIDKNIYNTLNINLPENKYNNLTEFLKELFPNEKVFENEYTSEKVFVLDKFIKTKVKNKKRENKSNYTKNLISKLKKDNNILYESLLPMNKMWNEYINNLLNGNLNPDSIALKILKADLHGSYIEVINSNNKNNIGIRGILIFESRRTFNILNKKNQIKTILKPGSLFQIYFNDIQIQILGDNFLYKSAERTKAKYKIKFNLNNNYLEHLLNI